MGQRWVKVINHLFRSAGQFQWPSVWFHGKVIRGHSTLGLRSWNISQVKVLSLACQSPDSVTIRQVQAMAFCCLGGCWLSGGKACVSKDEKERERWFLELGFTAEFNQSHKDPQSHFPASPHFGPCSLLIYSSHSRQNINFSLMEISMPLSCSNPSLSSHYI